MTDQVIVAEYGVPLSLYLDLEPGMVADLEVVSRASLAWAAALKELAYHLDPTIELRIELASGTAGSLSINTLLKGIKEKIDQPVTLGSVALIGLLWFGGHVAEKSFDHLWNETVGQDVQMVKLAPDQLQDLSERVAKAVEGRVAQPQVQQVYRELERDSAIRGVGATVQHGQRPAVLVPKAQFAARAGGSVEVAEAPQQRTISTTMMVSLIRPDLRSEERAWTFRGPTGQFSAAMKDQDFLTRTLSGATAVPMMTGIEMEIQLEAKEEFRGGVWTTLNRSVTHVYDLRRPPITGDLFPPPQ